MFTTFWPAALECRACRLSPALAPCSKIRMDSKDKPPPGVGGPLGRIYTVAEAAPLLGIGRKKLQALLAVFPHYTPNGNRWLLNDDDIKELWKVRRLRIPTPEVLEFHGGSFVVPRVPGDYSDLLKETRKERDTKRLTRRRGRHDPKK
jgi:excisionase family DNA binding protein